MIEPLTKRQYDVAFSFRSPDLGTALRLAEALEPLTCFVYTQRQRDIVTRDGTEVFGNIFGEQSRLNVVLYGHGYGADGWTRFEQEIIRGRTHHDGWETFALFRVDDSPVPAWVPATYVYGDFSVMSIEEIIGVIRFRAKQSGVEVARESAADRLDRLARKQAFDEETERRATSPGAWDALRTNISDIFVEVAATLKQYENSPTLQSECARQGDSQFAANLGGAGCYINWKNTLGRITGGELLLRFFRDTVHMPGRTYIGHPDEAYRHTAAVIRTPSLDWCWSLGGRPQSSHELAEFIINELVRLNG